MKKSKKRNIKRIVNLPISKISPNPNQPRKYFDKLALAELANSIRENGVIHPISVRPYKNGFQLISGERRLRASVMAGRRTIPSMIINTDEKSSAIFCLLENLQREDLSFFEAAEGYKKLLKEQEMTRDRLAAQLGKNSSSIANKIRLLRLPAKIKKLIRNLKMSERHANALLALDDEQQQLDTLMKMHEQQMSPPQAEDYIGNMTPSDMVQFERIKDINGLTGKLKKTVNHAKKSGIQANMQQREYDSEIEYIINVKK